MPCSSEETSIQKKALIFVDEDDEPIRLSNLLTKSVGQMFSPMTLHSRWTDRDTTMKCLTVAILLPPGVRPFDIQSQRILDGRRELEIKIK